MGYCSTEDVKQAIKEDVIGTLLGVSEYLEPEEKLIRLQPIAQAACMDADAEIDGYLCKRYPVPLTDVPAMISKISKDIAVYNLMSRSGIDTGERESNYLTRYNAAISYLKLVTEGKADIYPTVGGGSTAVSGGVSEFRISSSSGLFSRSQLKGM